MKKIVLILVALLIGLMAWELMQSGNVSVTVNGNELTGPMKALVSGWGILVERVIIFFVDIMLTFIFVGVGLMILGSFVLVGLILVALSFPFLLPILIPLFIVWVVAVRTGHAVKGV